MTQEQGGREGKQMILPETTEIDNDETGTEMETVSKNI